MKLIRLFLLLLLIGSFLKISAIVISPTSDNIKKEKATDLSSWTSETRKKCGIYSEKNDLDWCFRSVLRDAVKKVGTKKAIEVLTLLRKSKVINATFDDHLHAHEIGRETAKLLGITPEAFSKCPTEYNYGCQHGFFEYALSKTKSYKEAAMRICENVQAESTPKLYSYCYHGVGHGLMMALAYNLDKSLEVCNELPNQTAQVGCWQGSFMENSNAAVTNEEKVLAFSKTDPLSPCNKVEERYKWQCYINHAGYLMKVTHIDVQKAVQICLSAPDGGTKPCIQSIGLMTTNPIWQKQVKGVDTVLDSKKNVEVAWQICSEMPPQAQEDCVIGAVGNILNFDETNIKRVTNFCSIVDPILKKTCFTQIGQNISSQVSSQDKAVTICNTIKDNNNLYCLSGVQNKFQSNTNENLLITNDNFLKSTIKNSGPSYVIKKLAEIMPSQNLSCHDRAHVAGRMSYEVLGSKAFQLCSSECHSGCYHGAAEAFFKDKGTAHLQENLKVICQGELNKFFLHQCVHGVGHGLMAWSNYELLDSLSYCDTLDGFNNQSSCWTGVFMENIVGGLAIEKAGTNFSASRHYTKYLSQDPHFPCNIVSEKYKGSCYYLQTSRMIQLFNSDFKKVADTCLEAPPNNRVSCFQSMGRDVGGTSKHDPSGAIAKCYNAPYGEYRNECLSGASQDTFWDKSGKDEALLFCSLLKDSKEATKCYKTIILRASEVLSKIEYNEFCKTTPVSFGSWCKKYIASQVLAATTTKTSDVKPSPTPKTNKNSIIKMTKNGFEPQKIQIKKGSKIVFVNETDDLRWPASNLHPTHLIFPEFDSRKPLEKNEKWEFTFEKVGIWQYHDHVLPHLTGTITVVE